MAAPLAIGSLVLGGIQTIGGLVSAFSMGGRPRFREDPRFTGAAGRAEYMAGMGYTPQERAAFQGDIAAQTAGDYRRGIDIAGGNMSRALGGISTARTLGAYNRFAAQDAALRRRTFSMPTSFLVSVSVGRICKRRRILRSMIGSSKRQGRLLVRV